MFLEVSMKTQAANSHLICRGPDSKKELSSSTNKYNNHEIDYKFNLVFNRLSILDLSEKADQPMYSKEFNSFVMFNGEVFNHAELRKELENDGVKFKTDHSDSEVVLLGISHKGLKFIDTDLNIEKKCSMKIFEIFNLLLSCIA